MLVWNVFRYNINSKKIEPFNVFSHYGFSSDVAAAIKTHKKESEFRDEIKKSAQYYFWCRAEYEISVGDGCKSIRKVDIYEQLLLNWDRFIEYIMGQNMAEWR